MTLPEATPTTDAPTATARHPVLLTVCEAADMLSVGRTTAYQLISTGELEVVRIGRSARVPVAAIHDYVDRLRCSVR
jgi:excisionase family DNA binding protein